ncbi:MAG: hypothetical protein Q9169_008033 [Polycauliona sp. 2 TL-2023]
MGISPRWSAPKACAVKWNSAVYCLNYYTTSQFKHTDDALQKDLLSIGREGETLTYLAENRQYGDDNDAKKHLEDLRKINATLREHGADAKRNGKPADFTCLDMQLRVVENLTYHKELQIKVMEGLEESKEKEGRQETSHTMNIGYGSE